MILLNVDTWTNAWESPTGRWIAVMLTAIFIGVTLYFIFSIYGKTKEKQGEHTAEIKDLKRFKEDHLKFHESDNIFKEKVLKGIDELRKR